MPDLLVFSLMTRVLQGEWIADGPERTAAGERPLPRLRRSCYHQLHMPLGKPAIHTQNLQRHYTLGGSVVRALDGVSLEIAQGEFVALLGASGSGKSTLLNLLAGLDRPTSGSVVVLDRDVSRLTSQELARYRRETVGIVFQSFNLIPSMTVLQNVELPMRFAEVERSARDARAREALAHVKLSARLDHRPTELSGGEQQRVALARSLVNRPSILLADEPTGNLDSRTGHEILTLIRGLNQSLNMTVVMVTHERALAQEFATRTIMLADGKMLEQEVTR
jgi:ABC-type lipoprotein export system ATPase subunit